MLNHLHYEIIIFLYTEDKQENITLIKRKTHMSLPAPLLRIGIKPNSGNSTLVNAGRS